MSTYYPVGWNRFKFIITPKEMEEILYDLHHVVFNARVQADYIESPAEKLSKFIRNISYWT